MIPSLSTWISLLIRQSGRLLRLSASIWLLICVVIIGVQLRFSAIIPLLYNNIGSGLLVKAIDVRHGYIWTYETAPQDTTQVSAFLRAALARWPKTSALHNNLAKALWLQGQKELAVAEWRSLVEAGRASPLTHFFLGWGYERLGKPEAALAAWRQADVPAGQFMAVYGQIRSKEGNSRRALRLAQIMAALEPDSPKFLMIVAQEYWNWGKWEIAVRQWNEAATKLPTSEPDHWWAKGRALETEGRWNEASVAFAKARQLSLCEARFWKAESYALMQLMRWRAAAEVAEGWAMYIPEDVEAYLRAGEAYYQLQDYTRSKQWFEKASTVDMTQAVSDRWLGLIAYKKGTVDIAVKHLETAIAKKSDYAEAYYDLGVLYHAQGDTDRAITLVRQAIPLYPWGCRYAWHGQLGAWYREKGMIPEAIAAYEAALECRPDYPVAQAALSELKSSH